MMSHMPEKPHNMRMKDHQVAQVVIIIRKVHARQEVRHVQILHRIQ